MRLTNRMVESWTAIILSVVVSALADGIIVVPEPVIWPPHPHPILRPRPTATPLAVEEHRVHTVIREGVAVTRVEQVFRNPTGRRLEGFYLFPLPAGAVVDQFEIEVDGQMVPAEMLEREKARQIYESILRKSRDPALLELVSDRMVRSRIFPFDPDQKRRVMIRYTQVLSPQEGLIEYRYPLRIERLSVEPIPIISLRIDITTRRGIGPVYSPTHDITVGRRGPNRVQVQWVEEKVVPEEDFLLFVQTGERADTVFLPYRAGDEDGYFLLFYRPEEEQVPKRLKRRVLFVLDTSGSMSGKKIEQAREALQFGLNTLRNGEWFDVIRFSSDVEPLFGKLSPVTDEAIEQAARFVAQTEAHGGTALAQAVLQALEEASQSEQPVYVVLLTDGRPTVGLTNPERILERVQEKKPRHVRLFVFGVGYDVNTHLLDRLSLMGRGATEYVTPEEDLEVKLSRFFDRISEPILADARIQWPAPIGVHRVHPPELPDLFHGQEWVISGRYRRPGRGVVVVSGRGAEGRIENEIELRFPNRAVRYDFVPRVWAMHRVNYLLNQIRLHGRDQELVDEIVELARRYGILTPYTAYLIREQERQLPPEFQVLRDLDRSRETSRIVTDAYRQFERERVGPGAVGAARSLQLQSSSVQPSLALRRGIAEAGRGIALPPADVTSTGSPTPLQQLSQMVAYRQGKTFYLIDGTWVDVESIDAKRRPGAPVQEIRFGSDEFFTLLQAHPELRDWASLGGQVQLLIDDQVYIVRVE